MKRLLRYMRPYRGAVLISLVFLLFQAVLTAVGPLLTKMAVDRYLAPAGDRMATPLDPFLSSTALIGLAQISIMYLGVIALGFLTDFGQTYLMQRTGQRAMYDLRHDLMKHLQALDVSFFDKNPVGRLVTRVTTDVDVLNEMFSSGLVTILGDLCMLSVVLLAMFQLSPGLTGIMLAITPLVVLVTLIFRKKARHGYSRTRVAIAKINSFLQEHITGMVVVQLFNRESRSAARFDEYNAEYRDAFKDTITAYGWFYPVVEFLGVLGVASMLVYGGFRIQDGVLTLGILVAFFQYGTRFFRPIQDLSEKFNILQSAMAAAERVFRLLDTPVEIRRPVAAEPFPEGPAPIEFDHVWFAYQGEEWVLRDVSFRVEPGQMLALVGHTGAGKTTIISLLLRYYEVQQGAIRIGGIDIRQMDPRDLRRHFGVVLQDPHIFSGTIGENIRLGTEGIDEEDLVAAAAQVSLLDYVRSLPEGFDQPVHERGSGLSTGQKQLINFARALVHNPRFLILDEATASVDTETELRVREALTSLVSERTSIVIAHRLSTIQRADRILVMHRGRVREFGTHQQLLGQRGIYWKLYQLQYKDQEPLPTPLAGEQLAGGRVEEVAVMPEPAPAHTPEPEPALLAAKSGDGGRWQVVFSPVALSGIVSASMEGFNRIGHGGLEVGGVLFGSREDHTVRVLAHRPLECEYALGPSFSLSENDLTQLRLLIERSSGDAELAGLLPVGWYRSRTRGEMALGSRDVALADQFFPENWQVAVLLRPTRGGATQVCYYSRRQDGSFQACEEQDRLEVDPVRLALEAAAERRAESDAVPAGSVAARAESSPGRVPSHREETATAVAEPSEELTGPGAPVEGEPVPVPQAAPEESPVPAPVVVGEAEAPPPRSGQPQPVERRAKSVFRARAVVIAAGLFAVVLISLVLYYFQPLGPGGPVLRVEDYEGQLRIEWNRAASQVKDALAGSLEIRDGDVVYAVELGQEELRAGNLILARRTEIVDMTLRLHQPDGQVLITRSSFHGPPPPLLAAERRPQPETAQPSPSGRAKRETSQEAAEPAAAQAPSGRSDRDTRQEQLGNATLRGGSGPVSEERPPRRSADSGPPAPSQETRAPAVRIRTVGPPVAAAASVPPKPQPAERATGSATQTGLAKVKPVSPAPRKPGPEQQPAFQRSPASQPLVREPEPELIAQLPPPVRSSDTSPPSTAPIVQQAPPQAAPPPPVSPQVTQPQPQPQRAAAPARSEPAGPTAGRLIWTGNIPKNGILTIRSTSASAGFVTGKLPNAPIRVSVYPADLGGSGITVFTSSPRPGGNMTEPPGPQNGWNRTTYRLDARRAHGVVVLEPPNAGNNWGQLVIRAEDKAHSLIVIDWQLAR